MTDLHVHPIGTTDIDEGGFLVKIDREYIAGLQALEGFTHLAVLWWFSDFDTQEARSILEMPKPYTAAPEIMGIFATRSPVRPNPIALSMVEVISCDVDSGIIRVPYLDANPGSPVLDIKPYTPSADRVEAPGVPSWCSHWPKSYEVSGDFDWEAELTF